MSLSTTSSLAVDLQPGRPPLLEADPAGDTPGWVVEYRDALRAVVAEHGSLLVRGLGVRDAEETAAIFNGLATGLMAEREAFAPRQSYADGVCSSTKWPPNQQMCMHHELSDGGHYFLRTRPSATARAVLCHRAAGSPVSAGR